MNVSEFAESHGQDAKTVRAYIRRHKDIFEPLIERKSNEIILSEKAFIELEKLYKPPKPVIYKDDPETLAEIDRLKAANEELAQALAISIKNKENTDSMLLELAEIKGQKLAIEQKDKENIKQIEHQQEKIEELTKQSTLYELENKQTKTELEENKKIISNQKEEIDQLKEELAKIKGRSFLDRLFNK